jgi:hydrogenase expression/formation protein HypC
MKLIAVNGDRGFADAGGARREVGLQLIENAAVGEYVLVHAGFAIQKVGEAEALETLALFRELGQPV